MNRAIFLSGLIIVVAAACLVLYATGTAPFAPGGSESAKQAIRIFIQDPDAVVVYQKSYRNVLGEPYEIYSVNADQFTVDPGTGSVTGARFISVPVPRGKNIYLQQSESSARAFAEAHYYNFNVRNMTLTESKEWVAEYSYEWTEQSPENTTNFVRISVNTDGKIVSYFARDKTPPTLGSGMVGKDQAIEIATKEVTGTAKYDGKTEKYTSAELTVMPDHRIAWLVGIQVIFKGKDDRVEALPGGIIYIDTMSGEVLKSNQCCG